MFCTNAGLGTTVRIIIPPLHMSPVDFQGIARVDKKLAAPKPEK
jgi:hypothetical protein